MLTGETVGLEALIRWQHPTKGMISPLSFIPIAEETGLIIKIGEWVLRNACNQIQEWKNKYNITLTLAINLSTHQFLHKNFKETIIKVVEETSFDPESLELEITESAAFDNIDQTINTMNEIIKMGIMFSLDDFGTGYSSLNHLKLLPISSLKMDKAFVQNIKENSKEVFIADAIIDLAKKLKLNIVAEGVEDLEQLQFLKSRNCNIIQGYLYSKPLSADQMETLIKAGSRFEIK